MERCYGIIADLHLGVRQAEDILRRQLFAVTGKLELYARSGIILEGIKRWVKENKVDILIILGDIFHKKDKIELGEVIFAKQKFKEIVEECNIDIILVDGNHDLIDTGDSVLKLIEDSRIGYIGVGYEPNKIEKILGKELKSFENISFFENDIFTILPFTSNDEIVKYFLNNIWKKDNILLAHLTINGCQVATGMKLEGIKINTSKIIISGHIHLRQVMGKNDNIIYIGAFSQGSFGEAGSPMGGLIVQEKDKEIIDIEFRNQNFGIEFINEERLPTAEIFLYRLKDNSKKWLSENNLLDKAIIVSKLIEEVIINTKDFCFDLEKDFNEYVDGVVVREKSKEIKKIGGVLLKGEKL